MRTIEIPHFLCRSSGVDWWHLAPWLDGHSKWFPKNGDRLSCATSLCSIAISQRFSWFPSFKCYRCHNLYFGSFPEVARLILSYTIHISSWLLSPASQDCCKSQSHRVAQAGHHLEGSETQSQGKMSMGYRWGLICFSCGLGDA